jgi:hypothetical protein
MASNVIESEVVLFLLIDRASAVALQSRAGHAQYIVQARTRSLTDSGQEITNRVRQTARAGTPTEYTQCTKYLLPGNDMTQGQCVEIETPIAKEQYDAAVKFMNTISVKYRHSFRFRNVTIEIDHMVPVGEQVGKEFIKVDIEGGKQSDVPDYLARLQEIGIRVFRNLTEEGIAAKVNIGGKLMSGPEYNHALA